MRNNRPVKLVWQAKVQKTKTRGRPRKTWNDEIEQILKRRRTSWYEVHRNARNKKKWALFIHKENFNIEI